MRKQTFLFFTDEDNNLKREIEQAFNRVQAFCEELYYMDTEEHKAFDRIRTNRGFTLQDAGTIARIAKEVGAKIHTNYNGFTYPYAITILQAKENLLTVVSRFNVLIINTTYENQSHL